MMGLDCITLTGMEFYGRHGCLPEERAQGQVFFVDCDLYTELAAAGHSDALSDTVNYAAVFEDVRRIVEGEPVQLIECLAERIAAALLAGYPTVARVRLCVHKPGAPIPGKFRDVCVRIERERCHV